MDVGCRGSQPPRHYVCQWTYQPHSLHTHSPCNWTKKMAIWKGNNPTYGTAIWDVPTITMVINHVSVTSWDDPPSIIGFLEGVVIPRIFPKVPQSSQTESLGHGENDGTLGMVPLIINPIYTLYSGCLLGFMRYIPFYKAPWRVKQLGYHPKGTTIFPMIRVPQPTTYKSWGPIQPQWLPPTFPTFQPRHCKVLEMANGSRKESVTEPGFGFGSHWNLHPWKLR